MYIGCRDVPSKTLHTRMAGRVPRRHRARRPQRVAAHRRTMNGWRAARQITGACGQEIDGRGGMPDEIAPLATSAMRQDLVCVVRGLRWDEESFLGFAETLGSVVPAPFLEPDRLHPTLNRVVREATDPSTFVFGGGWHRDMSYEPAPPAYLALYAVDIPTVGGDTLFSNLEMACEGLSPGMRDLIHALWAGHSAGNTYGPAGLFAQTDLAPTSMRITPSPSAEDLVYHPLVVTNPRTTRKVLSLSPTSIVGIRGLKSQESRPILRYLNDWSVRSAFQCRVRWEPGTLVVWDNWSAIHCAINDAQGERRELLRAVIR